MAEQFYTILTNIGKAKMANAGALGQKLDFIYFALGDGDGSYYNPIESQTELKNEVWRGQIGNVTIDKDNPNWIVIENMIPASIGGFMIRESGIFDNDGNLLAIGKYPETYKPLIESGSAKDLRIKTFLEVANTAVVTLKIDPTIILATRKDIDILSNRIKKNEEDILALNQGATEIDEVEKKITKIEKDINERWGKKSKNINGMDLNDLLESGLYVGSELINAPGNYFCYVEVIGFYSTSGAYQRLRTWGSSGRTYERTKVNSNWQEWKQVANQDDIKIVRDRAEEAFQSASEGKKVVAGAITGKGVPTSPTDTFQKMATNIEAIETDATGDATALAGDIAKGKTAYGKGKKLIGTLELTGNALAGDVAKGSTFYNTNLKSKATGTLELSGDALVTRVLKGSTFYSNDLKRKLVGTMPNKGMIGKVISTEGGQVKLEEGYYQYVTITARFANLIPSNIKEGINVGGVVGNYVSEPKFKLEGTAYDLDKYLTLTITSGNTTESMTVPLSFRGKLLMMSVSSLSIGTAAKDDGDYRVFDTPQTSVKIKREHDNGNWIEVEALTDKVIITAHRYSSNGTDYFNVGGLTMLYILD